MNVVVVTTIDTEWATKHPKDLSTWKPRTSNMGRLVGLVIIAFCTATLS